MLNSKHTNTQFDLSHFQRRLVKVTPSDSNFMCFLTPNADVKFILSSWAWKLCARELFTLRIENVPSHSRWILCAYRWRRLNHANRWRQCPVSALMKNRQQQKGGNTRLEHEHFTFILLCGNTVNLTWKISCTRKYAFQL